MFLGEQKAAVLVDQAVVAFDALGIFRRPDVATGAADDPFARHADIIDGRLVGEDIGAVHRVLDQNWRRHVIDDRGEEFAVAIALLFEPPPRGDVLVQRQPATVADRVVHDADRAAVRQRIDRLEGDAASDLGKSLFAIGRDVLVETAGLLARRQHVDERDAGRERMRGNAVHLEIGAIADHQPSGDVEQQHALRHAGDRGVEPMFFQRQLPLRPFVIAPQLARHQQHHDGDGERDQAAGAEQHLGLLAQLASARVT